MALCVHKIFPKVAERLFNKTITLRSIIFKNVKHYCTKMTVEVSPVVQKAKISKAMKAYLERAEEHEKFMKEQHLEYQIGKRHLANMMGADPETFTQDDIEKAIEYLFPSGLYEKKARPIMKPPEDVFPPRKAAEFDDTGRPFHSLFYTGRPNFFTLLYNIVEEFKKLCNLEDAMLQHGQKFDITKKFDLTGYSWISKEKLEERMVEKIPDLEYKNFLNAMERLISHPYSYTCESFIREYTKPLLNKSAEIEIPKPRIDNDGRQYITTYECLRKRARGDVTVHVPGTGKILINGQDITYFEDTQPREQILFPLIFTEMLGKCDVTANVAGGGPSGQAGAIRWGISTCLRSFVDQDMIESMRLAGLLTRDYRRRERKKFGQEGARRKYTWKKR